MSRRNASQLATDAVAFPITVKFASPRIGWGMKLDALDAWLRAHVAAGDSKIQSAPTIGGDAIAVLFCRWSDAVAFMAAHADLPLADGTRSAALHVPSLPSWASARPVASRGLDRLAIDGPAHGGRARRGGVERPGTRVGTMPTPNPRNGI